MHNVSVRHVSLRKAVMRFIASIVALAIGLSGSLARAQSTPSTNVCPTSGIVFGFFNGVTVPQSDANIELQELRRLYGDQVVSTGESIQYQLFYNETNGFSDFVETFSQRLQEQDAILQGRYELFIEVLTEDGSWWSTIVNTLANVAFLLDEVRDDIKTRIIADIGSLLANPPTAVTSTEHRALLDTFAIEGKKMVFFAHSQGNLFVNPAVDYARSKTITDSVKVVHVAPASPITKGPWVLADQDLVINALRLVGTVPSITDFIPVYLLRPPGLEGETDIKGHGLLAIYLNPSLSTSGHIKDYVLNAFSAVIKPPGTATSGFFTASLTWDGTGDVDLHTFEPGGSHVFYASPSGSAGYLDVDNVVAYGPEHYYASCDSTKLQTGTYRIAIANYARATGRVATVQVASAQNGVLGTKMVTLGNPTGSSPAYSLFNVNVSKDAQGKYSVSLN